MRAQSFDDLRRISDSLNRVKRLSDGLIKIGPVSLVGIDGLLAWLPVPGLNTAYSVGMGAFILWQGVRAKAGTGTLALAALAILADSGLSVFDDAVPFLPVGSLLDTVFQGHLYAGMLIRRHIETTHYVDGAADSALADGTHARHRADMKAARKKRVIYLRG